MLTKTGAAALLVFRCLCIVALINFCVLLLGMLLSSQGAREEALSRLRSSPPIGDALTGVAMHSAAMLLFPLFFFTLGLCVCRRWGLAGKGALLTLVTALYAG